MPNLVGIGNSQVPTNAMLGGLAYQDSVGEIDIDKIKARILTPLQGMDIFVYDTRKDSDGGAWRKKATTQSWYDEGVSATRGARKEFPTVAVIVVENGGTYQPVITIYDGDDPNLPMWMVFKSRNAGGGDDQRTSVSYYAAGPYPIRKVAMLNGMMVDCQYRSSGHIAGIVKGVTRYNFITDSSIMMTDEGTFKRNGNLGDERNTERSYTKISTTDLVHTQCNDVAMTVLPNAPIDASTGLPIPTIAVATDGGTNVINNDGTVTQGYQTIATENVDLHPDGFMTDGISGATNDSFSFYKIGTIARLASYGHRANVHNITTFLNEGTGECLFEGSGNKIAIAQSEGLLRIEEKYPESFTPGNDALSFGLHNRTTSSYNTGWMHAAIKGAFLSSTDDTDLSGTSLIANGDFSSSSTAAFTTVAGGTAAVVGGLLKLTDTGGVFVYASAPFTTVVGNQYFVTADIVNSSNTANANYIRCGNSHNGTEFHNTNYGTGYGTKTFYFTATATTTYLTLISGNGVGEIGHWDNVFVYKLDNNRSFDSKGLQPYGTVTKTAVATGAELVAYSGFSNTNYFYQPYNSALDFGTGDLCIMFWVYFTQNDAYDDLMARRAHNGSAYTGNGWYVQMGNDQNITMKDSVGGTRGVIDADSTYGVWQHICFVRRSNFAYAYKNGKPQSTNGTHAWTENLDNSSAVLTIGRGTISGSGDADKTRLALVRIGATAPSEEQIKKIYDDEKCLFHENAKCTLHGTSDSVTALGFDDTTNTLHAGTSSGRSEFRGLNRINNTTTAVTTVISASDGLIAEQ